MQADAAPSRAYDIYSPTYKTKFLIFTTARILRWKIYEEQWVHQVLETQGPLFKQMMSMKGEYSY